MTALNDRRQWLAHLQDCTLCPVNLCDRGEELAAAVAASMSPGESWEGVRVPEIPGPRRSRRSRRQNHGG